jgi:hypothetical protein
MIHEKHCQVLELFVRPEAGARLVVAGSALLDWKHRRNRKGVCTVCSVYIFQWELDVYTDYKLASKKERIELLNQQYHLLARLTAHPTLDEGVQSLRFGIHGCLSIWFELGCNSVPSELNFEDPWAGVWDSAKWASILGMSVVLGVPVV